MSSLSQGLSKLAGRTPEPPVSWLMSMALAHPGLISLAAGFTDQATLPLREIRGLVHGLLAQSQRGRAALQYGSTPGDPALRRLTAEHISRLDARACDLFPLRRSASVPAAPAITSRLLITSGSQQLLYMPGGFCYAADPTRPQAGHEMRLSFGGATITDIRRGIRRLAEAFHESRGLGGATSR